MALASVVWAQPVIHSASSLSGDDPDGNVFSGGGDAYGAGADTWGDWLFVGAPREEFRGDFFHDGAVYIYRRGAGGDYVFAQKLTMPGSSVLFGDRFGSGIEAAGGWLFVGAPNDQDFPGLVDPREGIDPDNPQPFLFAGQVHVYRLQGDAWVYAQTLTSPDPGTYGSFGARTQSSHIALDSKGKTVVIGQVIGQQNNFAGGKGQLHSFRLKNGAWELVQTIEVPSPEIDIFGDGLVFASDKYLVAGGRDFFDDEPSAQGYIFVYQAIGSSGKFFELPAQVIAGPVISFDDCFFGGAFGDDGLDAAGGVVAVADPCTTGVAGPLAGSVSIYRVTGSGPLVFEATIEGEESDLILGTNFLGSRHTLAVSDSGGRILVGSPLPPLAGDPPLTGHPSEMTFAGVDVRVYAFDGSSWFEESNLTSPTPANTILRQFGDTVFFLDDETAFVREANFLDLGPFGLKSQGLLYDLTP
jgi:hypothetical protein